MIFMMSLCNIVFTLLISSCVILDLINFYAICCGNYASLITMGSSCGRADSVMFQDPVGTVLSIELPTDYHYNIIIVVIIRWCVWKLGEGFPERV